MKNSKKKDCLFGSMHVRSKNGGIDRIPMIHEGPHVRAMEAKGIYSTSISLDTLDEAPQAYKSVEDILDVVKETVDVIEVLKPVYNYKEHGDE